MTYQIFDMTNFGSEPIMPIVPVLFVQMTTVLGSLDLDQRAKHGSLKPSGH
jgi:hypothetical protein